MKAGYDREPGNEPNAGAIPLAEDEDHARRLVRSGFTLSIVWLLFLVFPIAGLYEMRADLSRFLPAAAGLGVFVAIYVWAARHAVRAVAGMEAPLGAATRNVVLTTLAVLAVVLSLAYGENWVGPLGFVGILAGLTLRFRTVAAVSVAITGLTAVTAVVVDLGWGPSVSIAIYSGLAGLIAFGVRWLVKTNLELREARREVARLAVSEERLRLSREIHDTLTQGFASIIISLHPLRRSIEEQDVTDPYLEQIEATARESLEEARRLVWALRPGPLQKAPLPEAVSRIARSFSEESGVSADASVTGTPVAARPGGRGRVAESRSRSFAERPQTRPRLPGGGHALLPRRRCSARCAG